MLSPGTCETADVSVPVRHVSDLDGVGRLTRYGCGHGEIGCSDATAGSGCRDLRAGDASLVAAISHHAEAFGQDFKSWCAANKVSRSTAYRHKKRIEELGRWEPLSTKPESRPDHQTPPEVEAEILQLRTELEQQPGQDCGADNIRYLLQQIAELDDWAERGWRVPSRATIHKIMKQHGLIRPQPKKRPKSSYRRFSYARPRDCYQIDATEVRLTGAQKAVVFEVLDDCTRCLVATLACRRGRRHQRSVPPVRGAVAGAGRQ